MRKDLKLTLQLLKPELKVSKWSFILIFLLYSLYAALFVIGMDAEERFAGLDIFFFMLFVYGPIWLRPKGMQFQKLNGDTWATPLTIMHLHLPIERKFIVSKSIVYHTLGSFPFQLYLFVMLYFFSPYMQSEMEIISFISFAIIWISFGIYFGYSVLPIEVGYKMKNSILNKVLSILLFFGSISIILAFPFYFTYGIVEWTIIIATKWPLLSAAISILAAIIGYYYWKNKMLKLIKQADFQ